MKRKTKQAKPQPAREKPEGRSKKQSPLPPHLRPGFDWSTLVPNPGDVYVYHPPFERIYVTENVTKKKK